MADEVVVTIGETLKYNYTGKDKKLPPMPYPREVRITWENWHFINCYLVDGRAERV